MSIVSEVLSILPKAEEQGYINKDEKMNIKEMLMDDENFIVQDYLEEYSQTKDQKRLLENLKSYIQQIASDDEKVYDSAAAIEKSPDDYQLMRNKKNKLKSNKKQPESFTNNLAECEEGLSPTIVFAEKKKK